MYCSDPPDEPPDETATQVESQTAFDRTFGSTWYSFWKPRIYEIPQICRGTKQSILSKVTSHSIAFRTCLHSSLVVHLWSIGWLSDIIPSSTAAFTGVGSLISIMIFLTLTLVPPCQCRSYMTSDGSSDIHMTLLTARIVPSTST